MKYLKNFSTIHTFDAIRINFIGVIRLLRLILRINGDFVLLRMHNSHADTIQSDDQHTNINHSSMIFRIPATHSTQEMSSSCLWITSSWSYLRGTDTKQPINDCLVINIDKMQTHELHNCTSRLDMRYLNVRKLRKTVTDGWT